MDYKANNTNSMLLNSYPALDKNYFEFYNNFIQNKYKKTPVNKTQPENVQKNSRSEFNKFITKAAIVVSSLIIPNTLTTKIIKKFKPLQKFAPKMLACYGITVAAGVAIGSIISLTFQKILDNKISKKNLISDAKDAFITSSMIGIFPAIQKCSSLIFKTAGLSNKLLKRFTTNGFIGALYAFSRGIIKPEPSDKLSLKKTGKTFIEGIFLGEGARLGLKIPAVNSYLSKFFTAIGASVGSFTNRVFQALIFKKSIIKKHPGHHNIFKDIFKGNSYPTIIY